MLYTSAQPLLRLTANLWETFSRLGIDAAAFVVLGLAAVGFVAMAWRSRRGLVLLLGLFTPYAILHLLFQENETIRYALRWSRRWPISPCAHRRADPAAVAGGRRRAGDREPRDRRPGAGGVRADAAAGVRAVPGHG